MAGFIDPISLITLGFLIVGLVVTTSIVKNPESLDIRNWAKVCPDECINDSDCGKNEQCYRPAGGCPVCRARRQAAAPVIVPPPDNSTVTTHGTVDTTPAVTTTNTVPSTIAPAAPAQPTQLVTQTSTSNSSLTPAEIRLEKNLCAAEGGTWNNNQCQSCQPGNVICSGDTLKTCNSYGTNWDSQICPTNKTCDANLKICVAKSGTCIDPCTNDTDCGEGNYCYKPANACPVCKTKAALCTPGAKQCSGSYLQTCNTYGTSWLSQDCGSFGCDSTTKACKPNPSIITQADCDKCLQNYTPSECAGVCQHIGKTITTPLGQNECTAGEKFCSAGNLKVCSNSGTWGLQTCPNGCENNACKPKPTPAPTVATAKIDPFANLAGLGTYGLAGNTAIPLPQSAVTSQEGFNQWQGSVFSGLGTGLAAGSAALGGIVAAPVVTPIAAQAAAGNLSIAYLMAQNALAASPALQTAAAVATLSQFPLAIIAHDKYGSDSPQYQYAAMGITAGYFSDVISSEQALQNAVQPADDLINQLLTRYKSISEGQSFERVVTKYQAFGSQTLERSGPAAGEIDDTYNMILRQIRKTIDEEGLDQISATAEVISRYNPRTYEVQNPDDFAFEIKDPSALSAKLICGNKLNCLELPVLEKKLLIDLGLPENEVQVIIGFGGNKGLAGFPYEHGAVQAGNQILGYFQPNAVSVSNFQRYANLSNWGYFGLSAPSTTFNTLNNIAPNTLFPLINTGNILEQINQ